MNDTMLSFSDVTIRFPDGLSFSHISLEIYRGEHIALVGNNEVLINALMEALAGKANIISGKTSYSFFENYLAKGESVGKPDGDIGKGKHGVVHMPGVASKIHAKFKQRHPLQKVRAKFLVCLFLFV